MRVSVRVGKVCPTCNNIFLVYPKEAYRRKFCSFACKGVGQAKYQTRPISDRFWEKVGDKSDPAACWIWQGARTNSGKGYGHLGLGRKKWLQANRVSYELHYGPIPEGLMVLHKCDVKACVNPNHLELGTNGKNVHDSYERSDREGFKKVIPPEVVAGIILAQGRHCDIAKHYSVSRAYVGFVKAGKRRAKETRSIRAS